MSDAERFRDAVLDALESVDMDFSRARSGIVPQEYGDIVYPVFDKLRDLEQSGKIFENAPTMLQLTLVEEAEEYLNKHPKTIAVLPPKKPTPQLRYDPLDKSINGIARNAKFNIELWLDSTDGYWILVVIILVVAAVGGAAGLAAIPLVFALGVAVVVWATFIRGLFKKD